MSQTLEGVNVIGEDIGPGRGDYPYPPQSVPTQEPRGESIFVDQSGPLFSMYLEMATEKDKKMAEGWAADANNILPFIGLFSAAVASLISVTIQDIRPNPQDTSNFYLANIYRTLADPGSNVSSSLPTSPPPFTPPNYAVWVNMLLFLSLVISITCALLAMLLQQWARWYLRVTQTSYSQHKRARIRQFFFEGVDRFLLQWAVDALPSLLHVSLFLFFAGISVFLWNIDLTIFKSVVSWIGICTALYGGITFIPVFRHESPYHTPLSSPARYIVAGISYIIFRALWRLTSLDYFLDYFSVESYIHFQSLARRYRKLLVQGTQETAEETALYLPSEIDTHAFLWTFHSLDEDHELERFFTCLPGFRSSAVVGDPLPKLTDEQQRDLFMALLGLLERTFSSDFLPDPIKNRRALICAKAIAPVEIPYAYQRILSRILYGTQNEGLHTAEFGRIVRGWADSLSGNQATTMVVRAILTCIVAKAQRHDDSWFVLASDELGIQERILRDYATHGDSLSLAILIHVTRQQFNHFQEAFWPMYEFAEILEVASKFNVQDTSPDLQHAFCALWNQIVVEPQNDGDRRMASRILRPIRNIYVSLHQDTDSAPTQFSASTDNQDDVLWEPSSYPVCNVAGHIHDDSAPATFVRTALYDNAATASASLASPDAPLSSVPAPLHVVQNLTDMSPLDNFHPVHPTTTESLHIPVPSPDPATAEAFVTSRILVPHATPVPSTSPPPLSFTSSPTVVAVQHNPELLAQSDLPNLPYSAFDNPVLDNSLSTGPPPSSHLPMTQSGFSPSRQESHHSLTATTVPIAPPRPTFAPDMGAATEDNASPTPSSRKENDALDPPSVNRATHAITVTLDLLPQFPSLPLVTDSDVAIAGSSLRERAGDHPPHSPHFPHDIV